MKSTDINPVLYPSNFLPQAIRLVIKLNRLGTLKAVFGW